jgi:hypothetical protein
LSWSALSAALPFQPSVNNLVTGPLFQLFSPREHAALLNTLYQVLVPILDLAGVSGPVSALADEVLVVGLELEFLWNQVHIDSHAETPRPGLFVVGDAAGLAQGIIQAMILGLCAGRRVAGRLP